MSSFRVLIVDDHEAARRGLRSLLSSCSDWLICGEAVDGLDGVAKAKALRPDLILMDISMPRMNGLDATRIIRRDLPDSKVVIISQNEPSIVRVQAREVDASGYVSKTDIAEDLLPTLQRVIRSRTSDITVGSRPSPRAFSAPSWVAGSGEMAQLIREKDWSQTSLGPLDGWPQSLKTSISICLASRFPIVLYWGPDCVALYNDAYRTILGAKHPWALGQRCRDCWAEIWDTIGPMLESVVQTGEATWSNDLLLVLHRYGYSEECYFSFSFSPVRIEAEGVGGVFTAVIETTDSIIGERRLRTLRDLAANAVEAKNEEEAYRIAEETLAENPLDIPFSALCSTAKNGFHIVSSTGIPADHPLRSLLLETNSSISAKLREVLESDRTLEVDLANVGCELPRGAWDEPPRKALLVPISALGQQGSPGVLVCAVSPKKKLDESYQAFFSLVTRQISTGIADARSHQEERKRTEALAEIDRAKTIFFSNVSHEFRTPLTLMLAPVEDLLSRSNGDLSPEAKSQLQLVSRNGSRLLRLVNTLLDFSRIEAGRMQAAFQPTDLSAFTVELASVFRSATEKAGLRLALDCPKFAEPVHVDRDMWEKIVLNLISNAFKFTFEGEIGVSLVQAGDAVELRVRDTGVGIPESELPYLFDRFHRVQNTRSRTHEGSGIGLALVQQLVKIHEGTVRVESTLGEGSTFVVAVPLGTAHLPSDRISSTQNLASTAVGAGPFLDDVLGWLPSAEPSRPADELPPGFELQPASTPPTLERGGASRGYPQVLVADDNADMRGYLVRLLAERYDVEAVSNGQAALRSARERVPDLILSDVMMPELDGFGLVRELRAEAKTSTIPIILLSARAGEEARVEGMEHGADDYLIKPFSARELLACVKTHLNLASVRRQAEAALREKERRLRLATEAAQLGIWHWYLDEDRVTWENDRPYEIFGRAREEGPIRAAEFRAKFIHADDLQAFEQAVSTMLLAGAGGRFFFQGRINRKDGPSGWIELTGQLERRADDSPWRVLGTVQDITERKRNEQMLLQHRERVDLVAEASNVGFWFCDLPFGKLVWDIRVKEHFWLPPEADVTIDTFYERLHPEDRERARQTMAECIAKNVRFDIEYRTVAPDGREKWIRAIGRAFYDSEGRPKHFDGVTLDISKDKQDEERERQITAEAMAATAKFRAVFDQSAVFAGIMTPEGIVIDANRLCLEACGYRPDEVLGRFFWDCGWWRGSREVQDKLRAGTLQAAQGTPYLEELPYQWADGTERLVEFALYPILDTQGRVIFLHPTGVDTTERKYAERTTGLLAAIVDSSDDAIISKNLNGIITSWNQGAERVFGYTAQEAVGRHIMLIIPSDRQNEETTILERLKRGERVDHFETVRVRKDGAMLDIAATISPLKDGAGRVVGASKVARDVTEQKRIARALRESEERFRAIVETTPECVKLVAADGTLLQMNSSGLAMVGVDSAEKMVGKSVYDLIARKDREKFRLFNERICRGEKGVLEFDIVGLDGTARHMETHAAPLRISDGTVVQLGMTRDITERTQGEERLRKSEEKFRALTAELENQVRSRTRELEQRNAEVIQQSEQLRDLSRRLLQAQDQERRHLARELHDSAGQIVTVLGIHLARIGQRARQDIPEIGKDLEDCRELAQQLSNEIRTTSYLLYPPLLDETGLRQALGWYIQGLMERSDLDIRLRISENFGRLPREMELVVYRLVQECLTNVHRHSGSKSAVISLLREGETLSLEIQDAGKGIPSEKLNQLQLQGAGVGIRGMRERIRQFDGRMNIRSNEGGTTISFKFRLPKTSTPSPQDTSQEIQAPG